MTEGQKKELLPLIQSFDEEETRLFYAFLLAIKRKDEEMLAALEEAKNTGNFESVREISERYVKKSAGKK